jgi:hypothetical protein
VPKTTRENLRDNKEQIANLTKTFADAIVVARNLGINYLWIDSLCIIQGPDLDDWVRESAQMCKVYQHAICNIAATASENGRGGLFFTRAGILPCQLEIERSRYPGRYWLVDDQIVRRDVDTEALLQVWPSINR